MFSVLDVAVTKWSPDLAATSSNRIGLAEGVLCRGDAVTSCPSVGAATTIVRMRIQRTNQFILKSRLLQGIQCREIHEERTPTHPATFILHQDQYERLKKNCPAVLRPAVTSRCRPAHPVSVPYQPLSCSGLPRRGSCDGRRSRRRNGRGFANNQLGIDCDCCRVRTRYFVPDACQQRARCRLPRRNPVLIRCCTDALILRLLRGLWTNPRARTFLTYSTFGLAIAAFAPHALAQLATQAAKPHSPRQGTQIKHPRSEERRVGKECRSRWSPYH